MRSAIIVLLIIFVSNCRAFVAKSTYHRPFQGAREVVVGLHAYVRPEPEKPTGKKKKPPLYPKVGDVVRYYDLDGGKAKGELLIGKISFIQPDLGKENGWKVEINEMEDLGEGYFGDYSGRKRLSKKALRDLSSVSPIAASFVRSEGAFKIPISADGLAIPRQELYDVEGYEGPFAGEFAIDEDVVAADGLVYDDLKVKLLKYVAVAGVAGTLIADLAKGFEDAIIFAGGALASLFYVLFLSLKTDTIAKDGSKNGSNLSNLRFLTPAFVVAAVALYNKSLGENNPATSDNIFSLVTTEQFAAAILGFLTYRIPLFVIQLQEAFNVEGNGILPGSAGVAIQLAKDDESETIKVEGADDADDLTSVLLVSGPQATGRSKLVEQLLQESGGSLVTPDLVDRVKEGASFEQLERRKEFLWMDAANRLGLSKDGIKSAGGSGKVVVVDADVDLAKRLVNVAGLKIVGVWVGLGTMAEFESRLEKMIDDGVIKIPEDETRESIVRARIREIVTEIEYGITSGVFEFTILNEDESNSMKELKDAVTYCK